MYIEDEVEDEKSIDSGPVNNQRERARPAGDMKVTEKKFLNVHQTIGPLTASTNSKTSAGGAGAEAAKAAAAAAAAAMVAAAATNGTDKVLVSGEFFH